MRVQVTSEHVVTLSGEEVAAALDEYVRRRHQVPGVLLSVEQTPTVLLTNQTKTGMDAKLKYAASSNGSVKPPNTDGEVGR